MGKIIRQELHPDGVLAHVIMTQEEAKRLGGEMRDITMFTEERAKTEAKISLRGRNQATKYFLIPRKLRKNLNTMGSVNCQRIQKDNKDIYVYVVHDDTKRESYLSGEAMET